MSEHDESDVENADLALCRLLTQGLPIAECARQLQTSRGTIYRRLRSSEFRTLMATVRREVMLETLQRLLASMPAALAALDRCLSKDAPYQVQLMGVRLLFDFATKFTRDSDFAFALDELKAWAREHESVDTTAREVKD